MVIAENKTQIKLTPKEKEVLVLVAKGLSNGEIAKKLKISIHTVKSHLESIYIKLKLHNKVQVSVYAILNKLIELDY